MAATPPEANGSSNGNGSIKIPRSLAFQIIAWIVAVLLTYSAVNSRISVLETKQSVSDARMERVERKIDEILTHLR